MITDDQISQGIDKITYSLDINDVPSLGKIKIDSLTVGRLDIIINKYYHGDKKYLPLLKDINKISDETEMKIGMILDLPDFDYIEKYINISDDLESDSLLIPGVLQNIANSKNTEFIKNAVVIASPKLKISLDQVKYDSDTGKITF